jgi:hypothetical protein
VQSGVLNESSKEIESTEDGPDAMRLLPRALGDPSLIGALEAFERVFALANFCCHDTCSVLGDDDSERRVRIVDM